jgi:hypothetical protein
MDTGILIYIIIFFGGGIGIWIVRELLLAEANQQLPDEEKIQRTKWSRTGLKSGEMSRLWQVHQQFLPDSSLRSWYIALWVLTLSWMFFGSSLLQRSTR